MKKFLTRQISRTNTSWGSVYGPLFVFTQLIKPSETNSHLQCKYAQLTKLFGGEWNVVLQWCCYVIIVAA